MASCVLYYSTLDKGQLPRCVPAGQSGCSMALYRLETKIIGRAPTEKSPKGQNAVACAAYRAGEKLVDETTGAVIDYSFKRGVLFSGIFAPKGAPDWMKDRQTLWNHVEQSESRIDARLAREYLLSLPHELSDAQRFQLVRDFIRENFTRHGLVVDVAIHAPTGDNDSRNYHAHIMVSLRQVDGQGFSKIKYRDMNTKAHLRQIRFAYARLCNRYLKNAGHDVRVDHRAKTTGQFVSAACQVSGQRDRLHTEPAGRKHHRNGGARQVLREMSMLQSRPQAPAKATIVSRPSWHNVDIPAQMGQGYVRTHRQASTSNTGERRRQELWVAVEKRQQRPGR